MSSKKTASKEAEKGSHDEDPSSSSSIFSTETPTRESLLTTSKQSTGLSSFIPRRSRSANSKEQTSSGQKSQEETGTSSNPTQSNNASDTQATGTPNNPTQSNNASDTQPTGTSSNPTQSDNSSDAQETEPESTSTNSGEQPQSYHVTIRGDEYTVTKTKDGITVKNSSSTEIEDKAAKFVIARLAEKKK